MKCSILCLTWNRVHIAKPTIEENLRRVGTNDFELLICDQGTQDPEFLDYIKSLNASYLRLNKYNEGISRSLNQLIVRSKGEHVFFMPSDILLPENWLKIALEYAEDIPKTGIVGFEGQDLILPKEKVTGLSGKVYEICYEKDPILEQAQVFGAVLMTRDLLQKIGCFDEMYHPYGLEDHDICHRCRLAQLFNYYIPGMKWEHVGANEQDSSGYKIIKEFSYFSNIGYHRLKYKGKTTVEIWCPFPRSKDEVE